MQQEKTKIPTCSILPRWEYRMDPQACGYCEGDKVQLNPLRRLMMT